MKLAATPPALALLSKPSLERRIALEAARPSHSHPKPAYLNLSTLCRNKFYNSRPPAHRHFAANGKDIWRQKTGKKDCTSAHATLGCRQDAATLPFRNALPKVTTRCGRLQIPVIRTQCKHRSRRRAPTATCFMTRQQTAGTRARRAIKNTIPRGNPGGP